jgi:hypothetical protein
MRSSELKEVAGVQNRREQKKKRREENNFFLNSSIPELLNY